MNSLMEPIDLIYYTRAHYNHNYERPQSIRSAAPHSPARAQGACLHLQRERDTSVELAVCAD